MPNDLLEAMKHARSVEFPKHGPYVGLGQPDPDGLVEVGWDQNIPMPAYRVGDELVPFTPLSQFTPPDAGGDWRVDAFTDAAIKRRWIQADEETRERIRSKATRIEIPHEFRATGALYAKDRIDPHGEVDLRAIRRPSFFAADPWREAIAEYDSRTSIVEVDVPREPREIGKMGLTGSVRVRGWHIAGDGVADDTGKRVKALVILVAGRSIETTAIHHPDDPPCVWNDQVKGWIGTVYPDKNLHSEGFGHRAWRTYLVAFARAGFDVLSLDKRGHGISGGANDSNANEQAEDIFRALDAMESGRGIRILTSRGEILAGEAAAGHLLGEFQAKTIPTFVSGSSQGCMVSTWAMHKNFVGSCDFDRPNSPDRRPHGYNFKGALMVAPFCGGLGYRSADESLVEAVRRIEENVQLMPSGEALAGVANWPALFLGRGLWDFSESLEGTLDCLKRCKGLRMLVTVRGSHGEAEWGADNVAYIQDRMAAFATAVMRGQAVVNYSEPANLRDAVAAAPASWAPTARPFT